MNISVFPVRFTAAFWVVVCSSVLFLGCGKVKRYHKPIEAYTCEGNCVPVRFEVVVPQRSKDRVEVYLSGSFNNWEYRDKRLRLSTDVSLLEWTQDRLNNFMGKTEEIEGALYTKHWIDVKLPAGDSVAYRYTTIATADMYYSEAYENRSVTVQPQVLLTDSVSAWINTPLSDHRQFRDISSEQERYLYTKLNTYVPDHSFTIEEMDSVFKEAERIWRSYALDRFPKNLELDSETYRGIYYSTGMAKVDKNEAAYCEILKRYVGPEVNKDLDFVEEEIDEDRYSDGTSAAFYWLSGSNCENLSREERVVMAQVYFERLPAIMAKYDALGDERLSRQINFNKLFLSRYEIGFAFDIRMFAGELGNAEEILKKSHNTPGDTLLSNSESIIRLYKMTQQLTDAYREAGEINKATDVLDWVTENTTRFEIPADTLLGWYADLNGDAGINRYQSLEKRINRAGKVGKGEPINLTGIYLNAADSTQFDLATLQGKEIVVDIWATWCLPCRKEIPDLIAFHDALQDREDLVFLSVAVDGFNPDYKEDGLRSIRKMTEEMGINYVVVFDELDRSFARQFDYSFIPAKFLLDKEGRVVSQINGNLNDYLTQL